MLLALPRLAPVHLKEGKKTGVEMGSTTAGRPGILRGHAQELHAEGLSQSSSNISQGGSGKQ